MKAGKAGHLMPALPKARRAAQDKPMQITDTHKAVKELERPGFQPKQAEAPADPQERTAQELVLHIGQAFEPRFVRLELAFEKSLRDQTWRIVAFVAAIAALSSAFLCFLIRPPR